MSVANDNLPAQVLAHVAAAKAEHEADGVVMQHFVVLKDLELEMWDHGVRPALRPGPVPLRQILFYWGSVLDVHVWSVPLISKEL